MENNSSTHTLQNLLKNPAELLGIVRNPGKYGMDIYNSLTTEQKQYVLFVAGLGLIGYAVYLGRKQD